MPSSYKKLVNVIRTRNNNNDELIERLRQRQQQRLEAQQGAQELEEGGSSTLRPVDMEAAERDAETVNQRLTQLLRERQTNDDSSLPPEVRQIRRELLDELIQEATP